MLDAFTVSDTYTQLTSGAAVIYGLFTCATTGMYQESREWNKCLWKELVLYLCQSTFKMLSKIFSVPAMFSIIKKTISIES